MTDVVTSGDALRDSGALRDAVRAEQVRLLYAGSGLSLVSTWVISILLCAMLIWAGTMSVLAAAVFLAFTTLHTPTATDRRLLAC